MLSTGGILTVPIVYICPMLNTLIASVEGLVPSSTDIVYVYSYLTA